MRYLNPFILRDLARKMIVLSGPRQTGKSTLAKSLLDPKGVYLNWDIRRDQKVIREIAWPKNASLVVLDELHKYHLWKNYLKGVVDEFQNRPPLLITGSAKLDTFRRHGDALTGRYFHYRLHPIDLAEAKNFIPKKNAQERLTHLLHTGGFPEAFLHPEDSERLRNDRFDLVLQEDLRDLSKTNSLRGIQQLIELLRERVGSPVSFANLAEDLSVSAPTIKAWIELLERLYVIFLITPYSRGFARSLRKEPKIYFFDCAASYENKNNEGAKLENVVASSLLKFCHFHRDVSGKNFNLHYFRDREKREVDFVVTLNQKIYWLIEVKTSEDDLCLPLDYLNQRAKPVASFQLVQKIDRERESRGISILPLALWLDKLFEKEI